MAALLTCAFAALYVNADIARYYLGPVLFAWTWLGVLAGTGVDLVTGRLRVAGAARPPIASRPVLTAIAAPRRRRRSCSPRRPSRWASDAGWSTARRTRRWHTGSTTRWPASTRAPSSCPGGRYSTPLWYGTLVEGRRPDLRIVDDSTRETSSLGTVEDVIDANLGRRPVYLIRLPGDIGRPRAPLRDRARRSPRRRLPRDGPPGDRAVTEAPAVTAGDPAPARRPPRRVCRASRTSSRPTTRRRTSRASWRRRWRRSRRSPTSSRSSPSTTARRTGRARSPTASRPSTRASSGRSTTTSTAATAARSARASRPRASSSSPSRTATASSTSRTSAG